MNYAKALEYQTFNPDILQNHPRLPSAACTIEEGNAFTVGCLMLEQVDIREPEADTSFTRQIHTMTSDYTSLGPKVTSPPDMYLFTAFSAIPYSDLVRGYYDASGLVPPPIGYIARAINQHFEQN